ncbi:ureohydrolase [Lucifera butyrica]|uniref:Arginase n=1 Tax=Lucifera butyrica TaxID=1351585 RepID=A0A498R560_9FIRM|nr:arginase [Lucifera butyrica]VBB05333.1 ureohydrolase [Lucifera butyrica]
MVIEIIGVPMDLGANRRGTDMGPSAIRYAGLSKALRKMELEVIDRGNIEIPVPESIKTENGNLHFLAEISKACEKLGNVVGGILDRENFPLILGGDHSIAIGSIMGVAQKIPDIGLIWFDAHGDFNTLATSETGNIHGMSLAAACGRGCSELVGIGGFAPKIKEKKMVIIGVRDLDPEEKEKLKRSQVTVYSMKKIDELGIAKVVEEAIRIAGRDGSGVHVSFDMDVVDPSIASGVGTPVTGGLNYREAHLALELIAEANILKSLEMVEVNPIEDKGGNSTAKLAVELITSALGKRVF